jgi:hypothetical protein
MRAIRFRGTQVEFQEACVHCLKYAREQYKIERTFIYGRRTILLQLPVPLCSDHLRLAMAKSPAQTWCERIGLAAGGILGIATCWGLMRYWSATGQGRLFLNLPLAIVGGICMFVLAWAITFFWLSPLFATTETKSVINSVRMTKYDPIHQILELAFANDTIAELTARQNLSILAQDVEGLRRVHISANILSHDIRLNGNLDTDVLLDHLPTLEEAERLLQPVIDMVMIRNLGEGCFYEISGIEINEYQGIEGEVS